MREALFRGSGFDAKRSCGKAIVLLVSEKADIAGAQNGDQLVGDVWVVERIMQAEARKARVDRQGFFQLDAPVVEEARRVEQRRDDPVLNEIDRDRSVIKEAGVEGLEPVSLGFVERNCAIRPEPDVTPGVKVQRVDPRG